MNYCEYTVGYADFLRSVRAHRQVMKHAAFGYWLYVWVVPAVSLIVAVVCLRFYLLRGSDEFGLTFWISVVGLGVACGLPARYKLGLQRAFRQRDALLKGGVMSCSFDQDIVRFKVPGAAEISYQWAAFTNYFEDEQVAVLFVSDAAFHTIPKRAMDNASWSGFRAIVQAHGGIKRC